MKPLSAKKLSSGPAIPAPYKNSGVWDNYKRYEKNDIVFLTDDSVYYLKDKAKWTVGGKPPGFGWEIVTERMYKKLTNPNASTGSRSSKGSKVSKGSNNSVKWIASRIFYFTIVQLSRAS